MQIIFWEMKNYTIFLYNESNGDSFCIDNVLKTVSNNESFDIENCWISTDGTIVAGYHSKYTDNEQGFLINIPNTSSSPSAQSINIHEEGIIRQINTFEPKSKTFIGIEKHITDGEPNYHLFGWKSHEGFSTPPNSKINFDVVKNSFDLRAQGAEGSCYTLMQSNQANNNINVIGFRSESVDDDALYIWPPEQGIREIDSYLSNQRLYQDFQNISSDGIIVGETHLDDEGVTYGYIYDLNLQQSRLLPRPAIESLPPNTESLVSANFIGKNQSIITGNIYNTSTIGIIPGGSSFSSRNSALVWLRASEGGYEFTPLDSLLHDVKGFKNKGIACNDIGALSPSGSNMIVKFEKKSATDTESEIGLALVHLPLESSCPPWLMPDEE